MGYSTLGSRYGMNLGSTKPGQDMICDIIACHGDEAALSQCPVVITQSEGCEAVNIVCAGPNATGKILIAVCLSHFDYIS